MHDWHLFDVDRGFEVRLLGDGRYEVRRQSQPDTAVQLTEAEFDQLRQDGPNPKGLD